MKRYFWMVFLIAAIGCSTVRGTVEPEKTATPTAPAETHTPTPPPTGTPTEMSTDTLQPTSLPFTMIEIEDTSEGLESILYREAQNARASDLAPYVQITADWCPACRALKRYMKDERMIEAYRGTYIILVDIDVWRDQLPSAGFYVTGVPTIFELTYDGTPTGRFITGAAWGENVPENMAPPLDEFFHPE